MSVFDVVLKSDFVKKLENDALDAAKSILIDMGKELSKDVADFVSMAVPSISRYINLLITKQISMDEFKSLMLGILALAEMKALTDVGLTEIEIDKTRNMIVKTVTNVVVGSVSKII